MKFAKILRLLSNLTNSSSFQSTKWWKPFELSTDTSKFATRAALSQKYQLLGYGIQILLLKLRNYKIYDKELQAIIWELEEHNYQHYFDKHL